MLLAFLLLGMAWAPELGWKLPCPAGSGSPGRVERYEGEPINKIS